MKITFALSAAACLTVSHLHAAEPNTLSAEEKAEGFQLIFDGKTLNGFRDFKQKDVKPQWQVQDGAIVLTAAGGGNLITAAEYGDCEFRFEFKISQDGNSGIMWHVTENATQPYESGPEYQILDSFAKKGYQHEITAGNLAGGLYGIVPVKPEVSKPAGEWNSGIIRLQGTKITLTINGHVTVDVDSTSDEWKQLLAKSKFASWPLYNKIPKGHFAFQDHGNTVAFRSMRVKTLK